jgi:hypothetical protein
MIKKVAAHEQDTPKCICPGEAAGVTSTIGGTVVYVRSDCPIHGNGDGK